MSVASTTVKRVRKACSKCGEAKALEDFNTHPQTRDRRQSRCKECEREAARQWRRNNAERARETAKAWAKANSEKKREMHRAWYEAHIDQMRSERRERARARRAIDPDLSRQMEASAARARYHGDLEKAREISRENSARRRARRLAVPVGPIDADLLWAMQEGICPLCTFPIDDQLRRPNPFSKSLDHIIPLSKGGSHSQDNVQWTHLRCNLSKGASVPE